MHLKLSRRRFGQLVIAGTATGAIGYLANKTLAQASNTLYAALPQAIFGVVYIYDQNGTNPITVALQTGEKLTGFTFLANNTRVLSFSPPLSSKKQGSRLVLISGTSQISLTVSGLGNNEILESVQGLRDGSLIGLVTKKSGRPPVELVDINPNTGSVSKGNKIQFPGTQRFSNLAECPNRRIYSTVVDRSGVTSLVQLDLEQKRPIVLAQLKFDNTVWNSGLSSLTCSSGGELLGLGARRYETPYNVYAINPSNGTMTVRIAQWDVAEITAPLA